MHDHKHEHTHANMSLALTHNIGLPRVLARPCKQAEAVSMGINVNRRDIPVVVRAVAMANPYLIPQAAFSVCDYMHVSMSVSCEHTKGTRGIIFLSFVVHSLFPLNYTHSLSLTHTHTHTPQSNTVSLVSGKFVPQGFVEQMLDKQLCELEGSSD